jgi:hypothetical protein
MFTVLYSLFWVIPWRQKFICQRFETLCQFLIRGESPEPEFYVLTFRNTVSSIFICGVLTPPMKLELTERSETSEHTFRAPGNHPKERIEHSD